MTRGRRGPDRPRSSAARWRCSRARSSRPRSSRGRRAFGAMTRSPSGAGAGRSGPASPHREDLDGRRARRLGRRQDSRPHPHPPLRHAACSRASGPTRPRRAPAVFRLTDHIERLFDSAKILMMDIPYHRRPARRGDEGDGAGERARRRCYIRPIVYLGYGEMGLNTLPCPVERVDRLWPWGAYLGDDGHRDGVRMKISSWAAPRPQLDAAGGQGTGMYINSSLAKVEAIKAGYDEAIMLTPQGYVSSAPARTSSSSARHDHHAAGLGGRARGHHPGLGARPSPRDLGFEVRDRQHARAATSTPPTRCSSAGTAAEVVPVRSVDDREIGEPGPDHPRSSRRRYFEAVARRDRPIQGLDRTCRDGPHVHRGRIVAAEYDRSRSTTRPCATGRSSRASR